jgi:hypothetical protein
MELISRQKSKKRYSDEIIFYNCLRKKLIYYRGVPKLFLLIIWNIEFWNDFFIIVYYFQERNLKFILINSSLALNSRVFMQEILHALKVMYSYVIAECGFKSYHTLMTKGDMMKFIDLNTEQWLLRLIHSAIKYSNYCCAPPKWIDLQPASSLSW